MDENPEVQPFRPDGAPAPLTPITWDVNAAAAAGHKHPSEVTLPSGVVIDPNVIQVGQKGRRIKGKGKGQYWQGARKKGGEPKGQAKGAKAKGKGKSAKGKAKGQAGATRTVEKGGRAQQKFNPSKGAKGGGRKGKKK